MKEILIEGEVRNHSPHIGCFLQKVREEKDEFDDGKVTIYRCLVHGRETCRCGVEFGYHCGVIDAITKERQLTK